MKGIWVQRQLLGVHEGDKILNKALRVSASRAGRGLMRAHSPGRHLSVLHRDSLLGHHTAALGHVLRLHLRHMHAGHITHAAAYGRHVSLVKFLLL